VRPPGAARLLYHRAVHRPPRRARPSIAAAAALAALLACSSKPKAPAEADRRYYALQVLEIRDAALNAHDLDTATRAFAVDAIVIDADTNQIVLRGREEIRAAHARFFELCPRGRVEVLDRSYQERGKIVTDAERVRCGPGRTVDGWVRYEIAEGAIIRVLKRASPPFGG
jgi:hypothetical protein